jgi:hypothetical protein
LFADSLQQCGKWRGVRVTTPVLAGMQIDDFVFAVAALDAAGHESTVSAYVAPPINSPPLVTR